MASWFEQYVAPLWPALAGGGGVWAWLTARAAAKAKQPADLVTATAAFHKALAGQAEAFTNTLLEINARLVTEVEGLRERVVGLENDNVVCRRENADLVERQHFLVTWLRQQGLTVPEDALPRIITEIDRGTVTIHDVGQPLES